MNASRSHTPSWISQCWLLLGVGSLGFSAVAALVLVLARTPVLTTLVAPDAFPRALVVHVNLATTIWFLSMACAFWTERPGARSQQRALAVALALAYTGAAGVIFAGIIATGAPVLANYVPYIDSIFFVAALVCFAIGCLATAAISLRRPRDGAEWGFEIAKWPVAMAAFYLTTEHLRGASLAESVWGAGHVLQFGYVTLLMAIWLRLIERAGGKGPETPVVITFFAAAALPASAAPILALAGGLEGPTLHHFHTTLMQWANWPAPTLLGLILLSSNQSIRRATTFTASITLFMAGCLAGLAIENQTTMIPAHYHGTIGAFTLSLVAATLARLTPEVLAPNTRRPSRYPLALYFFGICLLIAGLAWSGVLGAPRKSPFSGNEADLPAMLAATLTGLGGIVTIVGVTLFVFIAIPRVYCLCRPRRHRPTLIEHRVNAPMFASAQ